MYKQDLTILEVRKLGVEERWCMAVVRGVCEDCGRVTEREAKVNRSWIEKGEEREEWDDPVFFGYMGDCVCGRGMSGKVEWPWMWVVDV